MRRLASVAFLLVLLALPLAAPAQQQRTAQLVDRIVAVVGKEVVTLTELNEAMARAERNLRRQNVALPGKADLERQVLERLILDKAQLRLAADTGIRIDELSVDRSMARIADNNNMSLSAFRQALERDGVSFDNFRKDIRDQMVLQRLHQREVDDRIQVSESEIDLFLEENKLAAGASAEYNLGHVMVRVPEQAAPEQVEQARARAEKARAEARGGADFARVAAAYSDGPEALQGGMIGWRNRDRLPELFASALKSMQPGEVSEVLRSPAGFHVLKLVDQRGASLAVPVMQTRVRHILVRTNEVVSQAEARRKLTDIRARIAGGRADFADMARANSDDTSAGRGGELDWVYPGDTVPDFERAMNALKVGEISEPVQSPFGWHLIQVLERRTADLSSDRRRFEARQILRERKAGEAFQEWLRKLRDETYVEVRLDER